MDGSCISTDGATEGTASAIAAIKPCALGVDCETTAEDGAVCLSRQRDDAYATSEVRRPGTDPLGRAPIIRRVRKGHGPGSQWAERSRIAIMSNHFQKEIAFLGIECSPAFVRAPEGNGRAERFIRTLKENYTLGPHLRGTGQALLEFRETYNNSWLIQRHGFISPAAFRQQELHGVKQAA